MSSLRLRPFTPEDEPAARRAHDGILAEGDGFLFLLFEQKGESWADYLERLEASRHGASLGRMTVPSSFLAASVGDELVGRISIRHALDDWLSNYGGHIGYAVVPEQRRRGHAAEILRQGLVVVRSYGVGEVLVTCDDANVASARTIESCGGELESVIDGDHGKPLRRYWIR